jgi:hypothetical protein
VRTVLLAAALTACGKPDCEHPVQDGDAVQDPFARYDPTTCVPDRATFDAEVATRLDDGCGSCHGDPLQAGAPFPLTDYDDLVAGEPGNRKVDRIAQRVALGTMPPSPASLDDAAIDALVGWSTCGAVRPTEGAGLSVNAPVYTSTGPPNDDLPSFDVTLPAFRVPTGGDNLYECFAIDVPVDSARHVRRMQVVLDDARVVHHVVLLHDPQRLTAGRNEPWNCGSSIDPQTPFLYAWAPGGNAFDFEEGGLPVAPGDRVVLQMHYHNAAGYTDAVDSSGVRVFHDAPAGRPWVMQDIGPESFALPPDQWSSACSVSKVTEPLRMLAGMPHMHELGVEFHQDILRADGTVEPIVDLAGWNFHTQQFYRYDAVLEPGDWLDTWCVWDNYTARPVRFGENTEDEMCYHFAYVSREP